MKWDTYVEQTRGFEISWAFDGGYHEMILDQKGPSRRRMLNAKNNNHHSTI